MEYLQFWHWLLLGVIFLVFELLLAKRYLLWPGFAAIMCSFMFISLQTVPFLYQIMIFMALVYVGGLFYEVLSVSKAPKYDPPIKKKDADCLIGQIHTLELPIENGRGYIIIDNAVWGIIGSDMPAGKKVMVVGMRGANLIVKEYDEV